MKLSVIVPCYNVAPFLSRCLMSLTNQSVSDLEIICIDDKSTDNTLDVLKMCAREDLRIRIIENDENMGVGYSRNRGLDAATGEYVGFVDPDDWVDTDFYEKLIKVAEKTKTPVVCGDVFEYPVTGKPFHRNANFKRSGHWHWMGFWSAVYSRDFLNQFNLFFPSLVIGEDSVFEAAVKVHMPKSIGYVSGTAYHYVRRIEGANVHKWSDKQMNDYISAVEQIVEIYNMADNVTPDNYNVGVVMYFFSHLCNAIYHNSPEQGKKIAQALCGISKKLKYVHGFFDKRADLLTALLRNDPDAVIEDMKAHRYYYISYRLPGIKKPVMTVKYNKKCKVVRLFGMRILERHYEEQNTDI